VLIVSAAVALLLPGRDGQTAHAGG
jgi:hypothetical protein